MGVGFSKKPAIYTIDAVRVQLHIFDGQLQIHGIVVAKGCHEQGFSIVQTHR